MYRSNKNPEATRYRDDLFKIFFFFSNDGGSKAFKEEEKKRDSFDNRRRDSYTSFSTGKFQNFVTNSRRNIPPFQGMVQRYAEDAMRHKSKFFFQQQKKQLKIGISFCVFVFFFLQEERAGYGNSPRNV